MSRKLLPARLKDCSPPVPVAEHGWPNAVRNFTCPGIWIVVP